MLGFFTLAVAALGASTSVLAQNSTGSVDTSSLPTCALTCAISSLAGSGCTSVTNFTCICTDSAYQLAFYNCQAKSCNATELQAALAFGAKTCASNGTPINTGVVPSGATTSPGAASTSAGASASTTAAAAMTTTTPAAAAATTTSAAAAAATKASGANQLAISVFGGALALAAGVGVLL